MASIPPANGSNPTQPAQPNEPNPPPSASGGGSGAMNMTEFMAMFTPDEKKKFMDILVRNLVSAMRKESQKYIDELRRQREEIERGS